MRIGGRIRNFRNTGAHLGLITYGAIIAELPAKRNQRTDTRPAACYDGQMSSRPTFAIDHLREHEPAIEVLVAWFVEEWELWYGPHGDGDAETDLRACMQRDGLPVCLVALGDGCEVLGTAALREDSVGSEMAPGPWLAGLLVAPDARGQGIATALVERLEQEACRMGIDAIYVSTDSASGIMQRRGWQAIGRSQSLRGTVSVFRRDLGSGPQDVAS